MIYSIRSQLQTINISLSQHFEHFNNDRAHLHNAAVQEGYSAYSWDDMERFVQTYDLVKECRPRERSVPEPFLRRSRQNVEDC